MSATETRVALADARAIAGQLVEALALGCSQIAIAGSIRRGMADVGDIEIVAVPHRHTETVNDGLFEERQVEVDELAVIVDTLILQGTLAPHPDDQKRGDRYAKLVHVASGMQLDLFSTTEASFGLILLIRTGPAAYSQWFVTNAHRVGFHVKDASLHRGGGMADGDGWHPPLGCPDRCEVVPTPSEEDVYRTLGLSFIDPGDRR